VRQEAVDEALAAPVDEAPGDAEAEDPPASPEDVEVEPPEDVEEPEPLVEAAGLVEVFEDRESVL
jgi:hypothetical protein